MIDKEDSRFASQSFWQHDLGMYVPNASLKGDLKADVAIIGGGFTGLNTAWQFKHDNPNARVVVLEAAVIGFGSSGRNAGFSTKMFGLEPEMVVLRWGKQKLVEAHHYAKLAVAHIKDLIETHELQSDYCHNGLVRASYSPLQLGRMKKTFELMQELGIADDMTWADRSVFQADFRSDRIAGGIYEVDTGHLNPCKHVRELKRLAESAGVEIYETSPVIDIERTACDVVLVTAGGKVRADKLVIAANAYASHVPDTDALKRRQYPAWTYQIVTEPLTTAQWDSIGWGGRQSVGDNRQMLHYYRPTSDGRIVMGGGDVHAYRTGATREVPSDANWQHCEAHLKWIFPQLKHVRVAYRWGGVVSVNVDMVPEIGFIGDERVIYSGGCHGHGVALTHLNGRTIADLLSGQKTQLTDCWIVNRKSVGIPSERVGYYGAQTLRRLLKVWDWVEERSLRKG